MRLWPKPRMDEEYIELVRKRMSHRKTFVALHVGAVVLFLLLFPLSAAFFSWLLSHIPTGREHIGQLFAAVDGKMAGWMLCLGACCMILGVEAFRGPRAERLLLKFYDELGQDLRAGYSPDPSSQQPGPVRRTLTDEQYVTCIRKGMALLRWISLVYFCVAAVCLSMFLVALRGHWTTLNVYAPEDAWRGLAIGLSGGALEALAIAGLVASTTSAGRCLFGYRTEHLLLRFHDERQPMAGQQGSH